MQCLCSQQEGYSQTDTFTWRGRRSPGHYRLRRNGGVHRLYSVSIIFTHLHTQTYMYKEGRVTMKTADYFQGHVTRMMHITRREIGIKDLVTLVTVAGQLLQ